MSWVEQFLVKYPELAVLLAINIGYLIGGVKFRGFSLGPVAGSLFAGILIGQFADVPIWSMAKSFLVLLFLFGIGYSVGPKFLQSLKRDGLRSVLLAAPHEPHTAPRRTGRGADHDRRHGGGAGPLGQSGCRPRLYAGGSDRPHPAHDRGTVIVGMMAN